MLKKSVVLNKPRYVGSAILARSKVIMYHFHFEVIKRMYPGSQSKLLFTDTDSLAYEIQTEGDVYKDLKNCDFMDFSNYDPSHENFNKINMLTPGKFKVVLH